MILTAKLSILINYVLGAQEKAATSPLPSPPSHTRILASSRGCLQRRTSQSGWVGDPVFSASGRTMAVHDHSPPCLPTSQQMSPIYWKRTSGWVGTEPSCSTSPKAADAAAEGPGLVGLVSSHPTTFVFQTFHIAPYETRSKGHEAPLCICSPIG